MLNIIPQPVSILENHNKEGFKLFAQDTVTPMPCAEDFIDFKDKFFADRIKDGEGEETVILTLDGSAEHEEGYTLCCRDGKAYINAKTDTGLFMGLQTLKQMLLQCGGEVPYTEINDYPRFEYRGFMLDSGRYFYKIDDIKRIVDLMALHKLNVFHWHLTEDQGWRIEIKKYPLLTEKGSFRNHTNFGFKSHSGYYTQDDVREIVDYCHRRKIKVIPEFDIPGHTVSAIACYPYLSCFDRKLKVATHWGVKHDILCAGKESTYEFVFGVLDEIMELFPDKIIHIGGDEAVKTRWRLCPHCREEMKKHSLETEDELQMYFMSRVNSYLKEHGFSSIMWNYNEIGGARLLPPDIAWTVCSLSGKEDVVREELGRGRKLINTSSFPYYLDFPYGWNSLERVCDANAALTEDDGETWGVEGCMWTEYVPNMKKLEFLAFPRLGAIAENAWAEKGYASFGTFSQKLNDYYRLLDFYNVNYAKAQKAVPSAFYKAVSSAWFNRRVLHWQGLHNLIDNKKVEILAKKTGK